MRKFGDFSELSEQTAKDIEKIITEIEKRNIVCSIFYGFPLIELDNTSMIMKGCIISNSGILILHDSEREQKVYWRHIYKTIMECQTISELAMDPSISLIRFKKSSDLQDILQDLTSKDNIMSDQDVELLVAVIQKAYNLSKFDDRPIKTTNSLGEIIKKRKSDD